MVMKLNQKIEFCGKSRKFQRCPNKTLKDYQKSIEDIQDKLTPLAERQRDFQFKITELNDEKESIDKHIELLEKLEDPTDEEIRECIELTRNKIEIQKRIHQTRVDNDNAELEDRRLYEELEQELRESYATISVALFKDFDKDEFDEYADSTDLTIAPRLAELYRLATSGASQKDIDKAYKKIVKDSFR